MKSLAALIGCIGSLLLIFSSWVSPVVAGAKPARTKAGVDARRFSDTEIMDELFKRGAIDENGHLLNRQNLAARRKVLTTQQLAQLVLPSVVRLTVVDLHGKAIVQGSGFVVGKNMIATNVHVILGAHAVTANFQNGRSEVVKGLVNADVPRDLALIYADTTGVRPLVLATTLAQVGDPVVAVGSPEGLGGSISTGVISGMRSYNGSNVIQTTAPISPGSSGGALLDVHGQVLGITSFFYKDGQNLNFAYVSDYLRRIRPYRAASVCTWRQIEEGCKPVPTASTTVATGAPELAAPLPPTPVSAASEGVYTDKPLTGLKGVWVCVEDIKSDAKKDGLDRDQIKANVELRLRRSGITVFDKITSDGNDSGATLNVVVSTSKRDGRTYGWIYAVDVSLNLSETVRLIRPTACHASATTWSSGNYGIERSDSMAVSVNQYIDGELDKFANDYLVQNPK